MTIPQAPYQFYQLGDDLLVRSRARDGNNRIIDNDAYPIEPEKAVALASSRTDNLWASTQIHLAKQSEQFLQQMYRERRLGQLQFGVLTEPLSSPYDVRLTRPYSGYTCGMVDALLTGRYRLAPKAADKQHPAARVIRFLVRNGCELPKLRKFLQLLGDIRVPGDLALRRSGRFNGWHQPRNVISEAVNAHPMFGKDFCERVEPRLAKNVVQWCKTGQTDDPRISLLASPAWVDKTGKKSKNLPFFTAVVYNQENVIYGMCLAITLITRLIFSGWLSTQYHGDLFDEAVFDCTANREGHLLAFREVL